MCSLGQFGGTVGQCYGWADIPATGKAACGRAGKRTGLWVLVTRGARGAVTEFCSDENETPIFHAHFDAENGEGVQGYRTFRCEWEGRTKEWLLFRRGTRGDI